MCRNQMSDVGSQKQISQLLRPFPFLLFTRLLLFFFALGLMSKPMLVTWPFVMLLLDYWPLQRIGDWRLTISDLKAKRPESLAWLVWEKIPFFVLAAASSVVTFVVQKHGGALETVENLPWVRAAGTR